MRTNVNSATAIKPGREMGPVRNCAPEPAPKTAADLASELHTKYQRHFLGGLHTVLWHVLVNKQHCGLNTALTAVYEGSNLALAMAKSDGGYVPTSAFFVPGTTYNDANDIAEELDRQVFKHPDGGLSITIRSLRTR